MDIKKQSNIQSFRDVQKYIVKPILWLNLHKKYMQHLYSSRILNLKSCIYM